MFRYVSLITCCSADDDAAGARVVLRGLRGVSRITQVGVDKVGFNRLLVPYQHPLLSTNHLFSSPPIAMPRVNNTYVIPFEPVRNGPEEFTYAGAHFNLQRFVKKRGSRTVPYLSFANVYQRSERCVAESDTFEDLQLHDFVEANKRYGGVECRRFVSLLTLPNRVSRYHLKDDQFVCRNLRGLLE